MPRRLAAIGFGSMYTRGGRDRPLEFEPFEGNPLTSDRERYQRNRLILEAAPALGLGSPTVGLAARGPALDRQADVARLSAAGWRCRSCCSAAGMDTIVSTRAIEEFALRLKVGTHVMFPQSRHEILQETDEIRQRFWAAFDAYLGVDAAAA